MQVKQLRREVCAGKYDALFLKLYGEDNVERQRERYGEAIDAFAGMIGDDRDAVLFSAPGRTEIGGNHTDHNRGKVLAGSVNLDVIAVAAKREDAVIRVQSKGFPLDEVDIEDLGVHVEEVNHSSALIRGTAARFAQRGYGIGGFDAYTTSDVLKGSGLSSSAAFEVLLGTILNTFYSADTVSPVEIAQIAQFAENRYYGKPSGLEDQMACSVGGIISIDFEDTEHPVIHSVPFDFSAFGYRLVIVDVGGDHAGLTEQYAAVPGEMKAIAAEFGASALRDVDESAVIESIPALRVSYGDRAVMRAMHFFEENRRVAAQVEALRHGDIEEFKRLVIASGNSSFEYLQNVVVPGSIKAQELSLALCLAQRLLDGSGAWRVHGGGFGGTTQNFVPVNRLPVFLGTMESVFGSGSCHVLSIRPYGGIALDEALKGVENHG